MGLPAIDDGRAEAFWLCALLALLPFELRQPTLPLLGFETTLLEAVAALAGIALLWLTRDRLVALLRRPPLPVALLAAYAAVHMVSALAAEAHRPEALKFALRMVVMAGFAALVAQLRPRVLRRGLVALAVSATVVAALAVLEGCGARALDPALGLFREMPFNVGGVRRATAGSEYPNLAAAMVMYGLLAGAGVAARIGSLAAWAALVSGGLLFTYSRGALAATGLGLTALLAARVARDRPLARVPIVAGVVLLAASAAFAVTGEVFRLRLGSEGTGDWYGAVYAPSETTLALTPGERRVAELRLTNSGLKTWGEEFHLSYHWYDPGKLWITDGGRTTLPRAVAAGESVVLRPQIEAPRAEGRYLLLWDMVHEHTTWFSGQGVRPAVVRAVVSRTGRVVPGADVPLEALALGWRPGRGELWELALGMWRDHPWLGVGPDNFRWLYGPRAGHPLWDPRIFANNTLLEAAATTGTLGALTLGGALAAAGFGAWASLAAPAPETRVVAGAVLALVVGLAAHGVVDYVLAFTGHYLLFGFVVGAASAVSRGATPSSQAVGAIA